MNFLKWLTITTAYLVVVILAEAGYSYFSGLIAADQTGISLAIVAVFLGGVGSCLWYALKDPKPKFQKIAVMSEVCTMLGLLGSVVGFAITFSGLLSSGGSSEELAQSIITSVSGGLPTALNTTIMGIYAALGLTAYPFFISRSCKDG